MRALPLLAMVLFGMPLFAANWPAWRGPMHDGVTVETDLPLRWSTTENVKWKIPLPDRGNSTPIIWGDRVFLTQAIEKEQRRTLLCFEKRSGKLLWTAGITCTDAEPTHATNPYCAASPATDGERVIVSYGSAVFCYDFAGRELWRRDDLGVQRQIWGNAASPVIAGDRVFFNFGPGEKTVLYCFDKHTGRTLWSHAEPGGNFGQTGGATWIGSWSDSLLRRVGARDELIMMWPGRVCAYDPATGKEWWTCGGINPLAYNSPLFADGLVVAMGGFNGAALAVRAGGDGDVTATHRVWHLPKVTQRIGSGVIHEGHHYILADSGAAECRDLKTGALIYSERLKGPGATAQNWSSIVRSGDRLYAVNQGGDAFVWRASPKFELLATNSIGEKVIGSMAVSDGLIFIRGYRNLWCVGW